MTRISKTHNKSTVAVKLLIQEKIPNTGGQLFKHNASSGSDLPLKPNPCLELVFNPFEPASEFGSVIGIGFRPLEPA